MELENINRLYLELSQVATAQTAKEIALLAALTDANDKLRSAYEIAKRDGKDTHWKAFRKQVEASLNAHHHLLSKVTNGVAQ